MAKNIRRKSNSSIDSSISQIGIRPCIQLYKNGAFSLASGASGLNVSFDGFENNKKMSSSGNQIAFEEADIYMVTVEYRSTADLWNRWSIRDNSGNVMGQSPLVGSGSNFPNTALFLCTISSAGNYVLNYYGDGTDSVAAPAPSTPPNFGSTTRTFSASIIKISDL
jgi:hypothetical protein